VWRGQCELGNNATRYEVGNVMLLWQGRYELNYFWCSYNQFQIYCLLKGLRFISTT